jgi:hypothetical protein
MSLISFGAMASTTIANAALMGGRNPGPDENVIKTFICSATGIPPEDIELRKTPSGTGYNMFVSVGGKTRYVFKAKTSRAEIECAKRIFSLTDMPEDVHLVGVSHIATSEDLEAVYSIASLSSNEIKTILDKQEEAAAIKATGMKLSSGNTLQWYSLQPFVDGKIGEDLHAEMESGKIDNRLKWKLLFKRLGMAISYMHSKGIVHEDFNFGNWFFNEETGNFYIIDWGCARCYGVTEEKKLNEKIRIIANLSKRLLYLKFSGQFLSLISVFLQNLTDISRSVLRFRLIRMLENDGLLVDDIRCSDMTDGLSSLFLSGYFDGDNDGKLFETVCLTRIAHLIRGFMHNLDKNDRCPSRETIIEQIESAWRPKTISDEEWKRRVNIYKGVINRTNPEQLRAIVNDAPSILIDVILSKIDAFGADETV